VVLVLSWFNDGAPHPRGEGIAPHPPAGTFSPQAGRRKRAAPARPNNKRPRFPAKAPFYVDVSPTAAPQWWAAVARVPSPRLRGEG